MATKTFFLDGGDAQYTAAELMHLANYLMTEGILPKSDGSLGMRVQQSGTPDMNVVVTAGAALVEFTKNTITWKTLVELDANTSIAIASNSSGSNRVDAIIVKVDDVLPNTLKSNVASIVRVAGTGVSALSDGAIDTAVGHQNWYRLANVTVPNGASSIVTGNIANVSASITIGKANGSDKTKFVGDGSQLTNLVFSATDAHKVNLPETSSSGIVAGSPAFLKTNGEVTKNATIKTFISNREHNFIDGHPTYSIDGMSIIWLTDYKFIGGYVQRTSTSAYSYVAFIGTVDRNGAISYYSEENAFSTSSTPSSPTITPISATKFLVSHLSSSGQVSNFLASLDADNKMTFASDVTVATEVNQYSVCRISDTQVLEVIRDATTDDCFARVGTVSGSTISFGSPATFNTGITQNFHCIRLTDTKAVVVWAVTGSISARIANISGSTVTAGTGSFSFGAISNPSYLARVSDSSFIAIWNDNSTSGNVKAVGATVSGDSISFGTAITVDTYSDSRGAAGITPFGPGAVMVYQQSTSTPNRGVRLAYLTLSGNTVAVANNVQVTDEFDCYAKANGANQTITVIRGNILIPLRGQNTEGTSKCIIRSFKVELNERFIGVAQAAPAGGTVDVITQGSTGDILSSLTIGQPYFATLSGTLDTDGIIEIGHAIKTTNILLRPALSI